MGAPMQRGQARCGLLDLALAAVLILLHSSLLAPVSAAAVSRDGLKHAFQRRTPGEHVVLADCRDGGGTVSSEMAYFPGDPGPSPQDVAVVVTPAGQAALWVNTNTSGLFTDTGVWFNATLGPRVDDGQFAGTGNNGYGNFSCYQKYSAQLYTYGGTTCSQVYLCDHSTPPKSTSGSSGMSQGTIIGIAVGVVGGLLFLVAAGLVYWFLRRSRKARATPSRKATTEGSVRPPTASTTAVAPTVQTDDTAIEENKMPGRAVMTQMRAIYEVDGRLFRIEMANDNGRFEMDAAGNGTAELDSRVTGPGAEPKSPTPPGVPFPDSPVVNNDGPPPDYHTLP